MKLLLPLAVLAVGCASPSHCAVAPTCNAGDNDAQQTAMVIGAADETTANVQGALDPDSGIDWFTYSATATTFTTIDPYVKLTASSPALVCVYVYCPTACPAGTTAAIAPGGQNGCCGEATAAFQIFDCERDTLDVWMSVQAIDPTECNACVSYTLSYNW